MSGRVLFLIGATHQRTPLEVREKLALAGEAAEAMRAELRGLPGLAEFVVLNTCNRVEFYGVGAGAETVEAVERAFCTRQRFDLEEFRSFRLRLTGCEAVQHLLEVAGGLDSQMLGETEIFGQVTAAYAEARDAMAARYEEDLRRVRAGKLGHYLGADGLAERVANLRAFVL